MDRRDFLTQAGALALLLGASPSLAAAKRPRRFGVQLFSIPKMLEQDYAKAIGFLAKLGYREVETLVEKYWITARVSGRSLNRA
jgi:hypothetical protein